MRLREPKEDHARIFQHGFLRIKTMPDANADYTALEIENDAKKIAKFIYDNTSSVFFRALTDELSLFNKTQEPLDNQKPTSEVNKP